MDSANRTRLWVGPGLQWGPGTTAPKGATPLQPFLFFSFLLTLQFYVITTTAAQALSRVLFGCRVSDVKVQLLGSGSNWVPRFLAQWVVCDTVTRGQRKLRSADQPAVISRDTGVYAL